MNRSLSRGIFCATRLFLISFAWVVAGCRTLPNTQPFTDATGGLKGAVASVGAAVTPEFQNTPTLKKPGGDFEQAWRLRNNAMSALVAYAASIQAIVDSGKNGEASAKQLTDAVRKLADAVNFTMPGATPAMELAADTFKLAYGEIAKARAAKSLEQSLAAVQPAIELIARKLTADLQEADGIIRGVIEQETTDLTRLPGNGSTDDYRTDLLKTADSIQGEMRIELAKKPPDQAAQTKISDHLDDIQKKIAEVDQRPSYKTYRTQRDDITKRGRLAHELITQTAATIESWADTHAQMLAVVQTKRAPSPVELLAGIGRVHDLIERYQKL